jgi:PilZ domain
MHRRAEVVFAAHEPPARCIIHDLSDGGARISFDTPVANLPRAFTLVLFKNSAQRNCRVVWAKGRFVGVKFLSEWFGARLSERPKFADDARQEIA